MRLANFMTRSGIKGYHVLLPGAREIPVNNADKTKVKEISSLKLLNFTTYNNLILTQEETVFFHIVEESKTKANNYGYTRLAWTKLSRKLEPTTGYSNTRLRKKFAKCELDDVTRKPE